MRLALSASKSYTGLLANSEPERGDREHLQGKAIRSAYGRE